MGRFPSEVVYSLPEYSNLDHDFWYNRRGVGATDYIPVGTVLQKEGVGATDYIPVVHPQNVRFQTVWFQNVHFQNVQFQYIRFLKRPVLKCQVF
jgi:hypothetical protein